MAKEKSYSDELIKRNKKYLDIAKENGFFKDYKDDITFSDEWVIALWIDELEKKDNLDEFVNKQLPSFRKWFNAGIRTNMIGKYYYVLKIAEEKNIVINRDSADCLMGLPVPINMHKEIGIMQNPKLIEYFNECIDNLIELNKNGVPLCLDTANNYDILMELKNMGEPVNYDTFLFFVPTLLVDDEYKMKLYESRKLTGKKYGYYPATAEEVELLAPYFASGNGYNANYVEFLERKKREEIDKINKYPRMNPSARKKIENLISRYDDKVNRIKSRNIVKEYYDKFGTLAGLAYLKKRANLFIDLVDKDEYPIDNLFAMSFEETAMIPEDDVEQTLECLKIAHDSFVKNEDEIIGWNKGLPIDKYFTPREKERVYNVVLAAAVSKPEDYQEASKRGFK